MASHSPIVTDAHMQRMLAESPAVLYSCGSPPDYQAVRLTGQLPEVKQAKSVSNLTFGLELRRCAGQQPCPEVARQAGC